MRKSAWLFPGQGAQYPGVGRGFAFDRREVRSIFEEAEALSGARLRELSLDGTADELRDPAVLEPLLVAFSLSYAAMLRARGAHPAAVAGYSAGTIAALCCAGVLTRSDAMTVAVRRGRLLSQRAPSFPGSLLVLFNRPAAHLVQIAHVAAGADEVEIAGWNAPDHVTVVAAAPITRRIAAAVKAEGGEVFPVDVAAAWHSRSVRAIAADVEALLADVPFAPPSIACYSSVSGLCETDPERLRMQLAEQIHRPVLWHSAIANLRAEQAISDFLEVGCGRSLQGVTQRNAGQAPRPGAPRSVVFTNLYHQLELEHA